MKKGKIKKINWHKYRTDKFAFPNRFFPNGTQCGSYVLHALTKKPMKNIVGLGKDGNWSTITMFKFLRENGFEIIPITLGSVAWSHKVSDPYQKPVLTGKNVILIDQAAYREESTWTIVYGNKVGHSGEVKDLNPLEFVNWPIQAAYMIWHPKWALTRKDIGSFFKIKTKSPRLD